MTAGPKRPVLVVSDVHLSCDPNSSAVALASLIDAHPEHELVVAGDLFDLAFDPPNKKPCESIEEILSCHVALCRSLAARLMRGVPVTLLAGNHDAQVAAPEAREGVCRVLGVPRDAPLATFPWFIRRAGVHIEHGHFYDPDNAPNHPLSLWNPSTEPLGVAMTRRFVAPNGAMMFAGAYQTTPLSGLMRVLTEYRLRSPLVIANYFAAAGGLCVRARTGRARMLAEARLGGEALDAHSTELGISVQVLEELLDEGARPTHHGFRDTFMRLYFDRIFAAFATTGGVFVAALGNLPGLWFAGLGALYLAASVKHQGSRYRDLPGERLRRAAERVRIATEASDVIFGHTHVEDVAAGYVNLGSFAFTRELGRPYAEISTEGEVRSLRFGAG